MSTRSGERDRVAILLASCVAALFLLPALLWLLHPDPGVGSTGLASAPAIIGRSVLVAGGGALGAWLFGTAFAVVITAFRVPAIRWCTPLWLAPFLLPAVVVTTGVQSWLAGGALTPLVRGVPGAIFLSTIQMAPLVLWVVARHLSAIPAEERAAMRVSLPPHAVAHLLAGRARALSLRAAALAFLLLLPRLEVPAYTGIETVGRRVLAAFTADGSDLEAWIWCAALTLVALPVLPFVAGALSVGRSPVSLGSVDRAAPRSRLVTALAIGVALLPLVGLLGLFLDAAREGISGGGESSRWISALGRDLLRVVPLSVGLALLGWRIAVGIGHRRRDRILIGALALPLLLPGCLPALVWIEGALPYLPRELAMSTIPLSIVQGLRFVAVAVLLGLIADRSIPADERAAARVLPPSVARWRVLFPRARAGVIASAALLLALILGEVESAAQIVPPGRLLPAVELHQLLHYRYDVQAARLSLALAAVCGAWVVVACGGIGRREGTA